MLPMPNKDQSINQSMLTFSPFVSMSSLQAMYWVQGNVDDLPLRGDLSYRRSSKRV